jgi:hypothetical protein
MMYLLICILLEFEKNKLTEFGISMTAEHTMPISDVLCVVLKSDSTSPDVLTSDIKLHVPFSKLNTVIM